MPKPRPLTPGQAKASLANRLGSRLAPRLMQLNTRFGIRPYRVFLVWTRYTGAERGEGKELEEQRIELLPTPAVKSMDSLALSSFGAGVLPVGSVRLSEVVVTYTSDQLTGRMVPEAHEDHIPEPWDFFYEIMEDGRGDNPSLRGKFRLAAMPHLDAENVGWNVMLERISEDRSRLGASQSGTDEG